MIRRAAPPGLPAFVKMHDQLAFLWKILPQTDKIPIYALTTGADFAILCRCEKYEKYEGSD